MFLGRKNSVNLVKAYFTPLNMGGETLGSFLTEMACLLSMPEAAKYSINYAPEKSVERLLSDARSIPLNDLEYFDLVGAEGQLLLTIAKKKFRDATTPMFELASVRNFNPNFRCEAGIFDHLSGAVRLHYGYARPLREDYLPITEKKMRRSLFGGVSTNVGLPTDDWLFNPARIADGAFKGFYPLNYWRAASLKLMADNVITLPSSIRVATDLYFLNEVSQETLVDSNPTLAQFMRFDNL